MKTASLLAACVVAVPLTSKGFAEDCNANGMLDALELVTGRAFDDDGDQVLDECESSIPLPRVRAVVIADPSGCHWRTDVGGPWDLWLSRSGGAVMNDAADVPGNDIRAEIGLRSGVNLFQGQHSVPNCGTRELSVEVLAPGFDEQSLAVLLSGSDVSAIVGPWRVVLGNYSAVTGQPDVYGDYERMPDGYSDNVFSFHITVEINPAFDCNGNLVLDATEIQKDPSIDCDVDGRIDSCDDFADCNTNSIPDSCDIASGLSADLDANGVPDTCQPDCNLNDLPDAWEVLTGRAPDLNDDEIPDDCQGASIVDLSSPNLGPPSGAAAREWEFGDLLPSETEVRITVDVRGDLDGQTEWIDIVLNGQPPVRAFAADGNDCPAIPDRVMLVFAREEFNDLIGPEGRLVVRVECPPGVDASECKGQGLTEVTVAYVGIAPEGDCDANDRLDIVETYEGTAPDCNGNSRPDGCDIASGFSQDCNASGVPDSCELETSPLLDCNANGVIDSCDLAAGGLAVDCDANGRIDTCQVSEDPGTDCNGNLRPDLCDVGDGVSADRDGDLRPDECQTVTVPGDFATVQEAIDAAPLTEMRIVAVAPGTHPGPVAFNGKPVVVRGVAGPSKTIIEGAGGQQLSVVRFTGGEPPIAALENVTVRGGVTGSPLPSAPQFLVGGGILSVNSAASIRDCVIELNAATFGGGVYLRNSTGSVERCIVRDNTAVSDGGGLQLQGGNTRIADSVVQANSCNGRGGGLYIQDGTPTLLRTSVRENQSGNLVGGLSWIPVNPATAFLRLEACQILDNDAVVAQGGIGVIDPTGSVTFSMASTRVCQNVPRPNVTGRFQNLGQNEVCDCPADLVLDGIVNGADLALFLSSWGPCPAACAADFDRDGVVNASDLATLLSAWGSCGS